MVLTPLLRRSWRKGPERRLPLAAPPLKSLHAVGLPDIEAIEAEAVIAAETRLPTNDTIGKIGGQSKNRAHPHNELTHGMIATMIIKGACSRRATGTAKPIPTRKLATPIGCSQKPSRN